MKPGVWEILIVLVIVILIFGVGKIADAGPALGKAISGFKKAVKDTDEEPEASKAVEVDKAEPQA